MVAAIMLIALADILDVLEETLVELVVRDGKAARGLSALSGDHLLF